MNKKYKMVMAVFIIAIISTAFVIINDSTKFSANNYQPDYILPTAAHFVGYPAPVTIQPPTATLNSYPPPMTPTPSNTFDPNLPTNTPTKTLIPTITGTRGYDLLTPTNTLYPSN